MKPQHIFEVFDWVAEAKTKADRIKILKQNEHWAVKDVLKGCFDPNVKWLLPEGKPPYVANKPESTPSSLYRQNQNFKYFVEGGPGNKMQAFKREKIFLGILEAVHPADAEILVNMIMKKAPAKGITKALVKEAFPGLISE